MKITNKKKGVFAHFIHIMETENFSERHFHYDGLNVSIKSANNHWNIVSTIFHCESHALSESSARHFPYKGNTTRDYLLKQLKHRKFCFVQ